MATLCCKTPKLQSCKTSNCKSAALSRAQVSSFRFSFSDNFARWSGGGNRDMKPLFISCSILASSTTSPYRCLTRKLLALQLFQTKMPSNYLMYKGWYHLCVNASNCKKNVPKLDCEWKARRFVVHQTFRSCTVYTVNLGLSWGFGAAIIKLYISQTHQQGLFCPNYRDAYRPTYHRSLFCSNTLWRGNTEVQTRPISQLWRKGHNLLLAAAWSTAQPTNPRKAKSSSAKLAPSPV